MGPVQRSPSGTGGPATKEVIINRSFDIQSIIQSMNQSSDRLRYRGLYEGGNHISINKSIK